MAAVTVPGCKRCFEPFEMSVDRMPMSSEVCSHVFCNRCASENNKFCYDCGSEWKKMDIDYSFFARLSDSSKAMKDSVAVNVRTLRSKPEPFETEHPTANRPRSLGCLPAQRDDRKQHRSRSCDCFPFL